MSRRVFAAVPFLALLAILAATAALASAHGTVRGLWTSPHLLDVAYRI